MKKYFKKTSYTEDTLKKEFKNLAKKHHPDGGGKQEDFVAMTEERDAILNELNSHSSEQNQYAHQESAFMGNSITKYKKPLETNENTPIEDMKKSDEIIDMIAPKIAQKIVHPLWMAHGLYVAMTLVILLWYVEWIYNPIGQIILLVFWIWIAITGCLGWYLLILIISTQIMQYEIIQWDIWMTTLLWVFGYPIFRFFFYMYRSFTTWSIL